MTEFQHEWAAPDTLLPEPSRPCAHWIERVRKAEAEVKRLREVHFEDTRNLMGAGVRMTELEAEFERLREQIDWTVTRCNAAMGDDFQGTPNSSVAAVCDEVERLREDDQAKTSLFYEQMRRAEKAEAEVERLREENATLRELLAVRDVPDAAVEGALAADRLARRMASDITDLPSVRLNRSSSRPS